jgi:hypothetical protein
MQELVMKVKYLFVLSFVLCSVSAAAQVRNRVFNRGIVSSAFSERYMDSLRLVNQRLDSIYNLSLARQTVEERLESQRYSTLFLPLTFYNGVAHQSFSLDDDVSDLDKTLLNVYLHRPDLISNTESQLDRINIIEPVTKKQKTETNIVEKVAPVPIEPDVIPMEVMIKKPNFWTISGDYYLQFLQNYVSSNWYKGGESNYSAVGAVTLNANYNNKQKVKWENKLEMKLGMQASRGDTLHSMKTSEDLLRYTSRLGLQASTHWYYTLQMVAYTQFLRGYKSNDSFVYSDFLSPLNVNLSLGMDYTVEWLNKRLTGTIHLAPFAYNFKYVQRLELSTRYGLDEGKHALNDIGSEFDINLLWKMTDNISWKTRFYAYTTYKRSELEWENTFSFQFNKYISTNIFVYPRFDDGASRDDHHGFWQLKEYASIGFAYSF